jgi:2-isopropylmalate synthase
LHLIDATLREGLQACRVAVRPEAAAALVALLEAVGIRHIECTHAGARPEWDAILAAVLGARRQAQVMTHARARESDIRAAIASGADGVGIFLGVNRQTIEARTPGRSREDLLAMARESIVVAKQAGLTVRYSIEDASRTEPGDLWRACEVAVEAGADRLCCPDTLGLLEPDQTRALFAELRRRFPGVALEAHLHNDRGLAVANALAALDGGADFVSTSVNGIGERSGITDTCVLIANLVHRGVGARFDASLLPALSQAASETLGEPVAPRHPVTGAWAFWHQCDLHRKAWTRSPSSYEWIEPPRLGRISEAPA